MMMYSLDQNKKYTSWTNCNRRNRETWRCQRVNLGKALGSAELQSREVEVYWIGGKGLVGFLVLLVLCPISFLWLSR
jgi:hypothetical protein